MDDVTFTFGKHRGKTFRYVLESEKGYVQWAKGLPSVSGQLRDFVEYCNAGGAPLGSTGGGASSAVGGDASEEAAAAPARHLPPSFGAFAYGQPLVTSAAAPAALGHSQAAAPLAAAAGVTPAPVPAPASTPAPTAGIGLTAELCGPEEFQISPAQPAFVPQPIWQELTRLPGATLGDSKRHWRFPMAEYEEVLQRIRTNPVLAACDVEPLADWVVRAVRQAREALGPKDEADLKLKEYLEALPREIVEERPVMPFQEDGIRFGVAHGGRCLLGDEMGLGKTLQALAIAGQFVDDWPVLVVVPSALRLVWRDQALAWLPHLLRDSSEVTVIAQGKQQVSKESKLVIISYDLLARNPRFQRRTDGKAYGVTIVDEAHYIKDAKSKRTQVVLQICKDAARCVLISGTPAVNRAVELFTQLQCLLPSMPSFTRYCERYCERQEQFVRGARIVKWAGAKRKAELNTLLTGTVMIRRLKRDVLTQLPPKRRQRITLDSSKLDAAKMKEIRKFLSGDSVFAVDEGPAPEIMETFKLTAEAKVDGVGEYVEYLLGNDLKFLIFAHHHVMLDGIEDKLKVCQARYIRIDGHTPQQKRQQLVDSFQNDEAVKVALLSITACGQGLTLTAAHTVVFAELYWVPGQLMQAEDRVHRIGQEHSVDIHYCIAEGSLDEKVFMSLNKKARDTTGILDGVERCMGAWDQSAAPAAPSRGIQAALAAGASEGSCATAVSASESGSSSAVADAPAASGAGRRKRQRDQAAARGLDKFFKKSAEPSEAPS